MNDKRSPVNTEGTRTTGPVGRAKGWLMSNGNGTAVWVRWAVGFIVVGLIGLASYTSARTQDRFTSEQATAMSAQMIERDEALLLALNVHIAAAGHTVMVERAANLDERLRSIEETLDLLLARER